MSGSKKMVCLNMQAVCNSKYLFTAVTCMHVGCTNDANAFETCSLKDLCASLPFPFHWNGDNAYTLSESLMIPYPGQNLHITHPSLEAFNFYHSQLRIWIECTFGIFIRRWGILWKPMEFDLNFQFEIIHALCRLHNFCMQRALPISNHRVSSTSNIEVNADGRLIDDRWRAGIVPIQLNENTVGNTLRLDIVDKITRLGLRRVRSHNV